MNELAQKVLASISAVVAGAAAVCFAVLTFLLRRRTRELQESRVETLEIRHASQNEKREAEIAASKAKVEAHGKDALTKARLLRSLLDDGRDDSGRGR